MVIMQLVPTIVELALIVVVLLYQFDWRYVAVVLVTVALLHVCSPIWRPSGASTSAAG